MERNLSRAFKLIGLLALSLSAQAQVTLSTGVDAWKVNNGPARYLPDYSTPREYQTLNPWAQIDAKHEIDRVTLSAQLKSSVIYGGRLNRLDVDYRGDYVGARVGILPYRISWCGNSNWMAEPDAFCRFHGLNEVAEGAFGAQVYSSILTKGWLIDGMVGAYNPQIDKQADSLGPYVKVGPTVSHKAHGASLNALHLPTGIQTRAGWLRTNQVQDSETGSFQRRLSYDSYYLGAEGNITRSIDLRASLSGYIGDQTNPANKYKWDGRSKTLELAYKPLSGHTLSIGVSEYENITKYATRPNPQTLNVVSQSIAYRVDFDKWWIICQATKTDDKSRTSAGVLTAREGDAIGLRIGRTFD